MYSIEEINAIIPDRDELERRYPRLLRRMKWVAILNTSEALSALEGYLMNRDLGTACGGSEAVNHFGGPKVVIEAAIQSHHLWRKLDMGDQS